MHSLNDSGIRPKPGQDRDRVDRWLTVALILSVALVFAAYAMRFLELATGKPRFWGHGLLGHSGMAPYFWNSLALAAFAFRTTHRQRALRSQNRLAHPGILGWSLAWFVGLTILMALAAFTRLRSSSWFNVGMTVFIVLGFSAMAILVQRRCRAQGFRYSARQKILLILMLIVAVVGILVPIIQAQWMR